MAKQSAGILLFRKVKDHFEVMLAHPGGPFWAKKEIGAWSIPKGEFEPDEEPLAAAKREFEEEIGKAVPKGEFIQLGAVKQPSGKIVHAWALESDFDTSNIKSNLITISWPPRSGNQMEIPEIDRAEWFNLDVAILKIIKGQVPFIEALADHLGVKLKQPDETGPQSSLF